jgi:hypothetical protein
MLAPGRQVEAQQEIAASKGITIGPFRQVLFIAIENGNEKPQESVSDCCSRKASWLQIGGK